MHLRAIAPAHQRADKRQQVRPAEQDDDERGGDQSGEDEQAEHHASLCAASVFFIEPNELPSQNAPTELMHSSTPVTICVRSSAV